MIVSVRLTLLPYGLPMLLETLYVAAQIAAQGEIKALHNVVSADCMSPTMYLPRQNAIHHGICPDLLFCKTHQRWSKSAL